MCPHCDHHERIGSKEYFDILFDDGKFRELQAKMASANPLEFKDTKAYEDRLEASMAKTGLKDAIRTGVGEVGGRQMVICCMDFSFIGGSMGSVVGEKMARGIDYALKMDCLCLHHQEWRCPHDGGRFVPHANGQDQRPPQHARQSGPALRLHLDGSHDGRGDRFLRHVG